MYDYEVMRNKVRKGNSSKVQSKFLKPKMLQNNRFRYFSLYYYKCSDYIINLYRLTFIGCLALRNYLIPTLLASLLEFFFQAMLSIVVAPSLFVKELGSGLS